LSPVQVESFCALSLSSEELLMSLPSRLPKPDPEPKPKREDPSPDPGTDPGRTDPDRDPNGNRDVETDDSPAEREDIERDGSV